MNLVHGAMGRKSHIEIKPRRFIYVLHNWQGHSSGSQFDIFLLKIDNELISFSESLQIFRSRWEIVLVPYLTHLTYMQVLWNWKCFSWFLDSIHF